MNEPRHAAPSEVESPLPWEDGLERQLEAHSNLVAILVLTAGLLLRLRAASGTFLNPDEALHFLLANQATWLLAYKASLTNAHPPQLTWVLFFWRELGRSEFALRLPSVICGTAFCWIFFKWTVRLFGMCAGLVGLILASFLPPMIELSAEVRQYAFLLLFLAGAACFLEKALAEGSARLMVLSGMCLYFAMLSHYSAILFAAAMGIYSLLRLIVCRASNKVWVAWVSSQAGVLGLFAALYVTHISRLEGDYASGTVNGWLGNSFFRPGRGNPILFVVAHTGGVFQYAFGQLVVGDVAFLAFVLGVLLLWRKRVSHAYSKVSAKYLAIFLVLPFVIGAGASLARLYPYGGTRHSAFLLMFVLAGVSSVVAKLVAQRTGRGVLLAVLVVTVCGAFGKPHRPYMLREDQSRRQMDHALQFIRQNVGPSEPILVDHQSGLLLAFYLCPTEPGSFDSSAGSKEFNCGGYRIVSSGPSPYVFTTTTFLSRWNEFVKMYDLRTDQRVWIFQAGWDIVLERDWESAFPQLRQGHTQSFGRNITIFSLTVDQPTQVAPQGD